MNGYSPLTSVPLPATLSGSLSKDTNMKLSKYLFPTLKEVPSDAVVISHVLMLRAGMIRKVSAGIYNYLPLALRTIDKIETIIREEMDASGALELLMPAVQPAELWIESGRWGYYGPELLRFKDRKDQDYCLGPTHEEVITSIVRNEIRSYREIPVTLYQIQTKFRDEVRPRFGLMRGREFIMKDAYSFDLDEEGAKKSYGIMNETYRRIFTRCGLRFKAVEAGTGAIGGTLSHEFQVLASNGEDEILSCDACDYAANVEKCECVTPDASKAPASGSAKIEEVKTPDQRTVEEVCAFLKVPQERLVKTLVYTADGAPVAILVRGDHELAEAKLVAILKCNELLPADEATIAKVTGGPLGFSGPIGLATGIPLYADHSVGLVRDAVVGANKADTHIVHADPDRDFPKGVVYADLRKALEGEPCPRCGGGHYQKYRGIEVGQIFYLGTKYSEKMDASVLDEKGAKRTLVMGCYGIGVTRTMAAAIEQNNDEKGIIWPFAIAPFHVILCPAGTDPQIKETADGLYSALLSEKVEVLYDDRGERPGVMFADADLIGIPLRVTIGKKGLADGKVELKLRREKEATFVPIADAVARIREKISNEIGT
jgi:prolyl-tRNA synthetase